MAPATITKAPACEWMLTALRDSERSSSRECRADAQVGTNVEGVATTSDEERQPGTEDIVNRAGGSSQGCGIHAEVFE